MPLAVIEPKRGSRNINADNGAPDIGSHRVRRSSDLAALVVVDRLCDWRRVEDYRLNRMLLQLVETPGRIC
jgi:hypothetical protein